MLLLAQVGAQGVGGFQLDVRSWSTLADRDQKAMNGPS